MSEAALSEAAMRAALLDIHLPLEAGGGQIAEIAAAIAFGGAAALTVALVLRLLSQRRAARAETSLAQFLDRLNTDTEPRRRVELLHLLKTYAPDRFAELAKDLYRPGSQISTQRLETELRDLA